VQGEKNALHPGKKNQNRYTEYMRRILSTVLFLFFAVGFLQPVWAVPSSIKAVQDFENGVIQSEVNKQPNLQAFAGKDNLGAIGSGLLCNLVTCDDIQPYVAGGAIESAGSAIAYLYAVPPASAQVYVADLARTAGFGLAEPAYAQGIGFASLNPILGAWKIFRNVAYALYVIIFVVVGFMIMFRQKIGGQAAVTVQQALPSIIISLLAVTFSYAIAGLLIDVMYLLMYLIVGLFGTSGDKINGNFLTLAGSLLFGGVQIGAGGAGKVISDFVNQLVGNGTIAQIATVVSQLTLAIVLAIAILIRIVQLFFELLKTYVELILGITLAPLLLMAGAIPGKPTFGMWIRGLLGGLSVFPTILVLLVIFDQITNSATANNSTIYGGFMPPFIITSGGFSGPLFRFLVGTGIIILMPDFVAEVKKTIGGGGFLDKFGSSYLKGLGQGWSGGEIIPGMAWSNTNKIPFFGSGRDALQKQAIAGGTLLGAVGGAVRSTPGALGDVVGLTATGANPATGLARGGRGMGQRLSDLFQDKQLFTKNRSARQPGSGKPPTSQYGSP